MWTSDWSHLVSVSALWRHKFRSRCSSSITEQASSVSSSGVLSKCFCIVQIKGLGLVFFDTWPLKPSICDSLRLTSSNSSNSSNSHPEVSYQSYHLPCQLQTARSTHHWPSSSGTSFPRSSGTSPGTPQLLWQLLVFIMFSFLLLKQHHQLWCADVPLVQSQVAQSFVNRNDPTFIEFIAMVWSFRPVREWMTQWRDQSVTSDAPFESETPTSLQCTMQAMAVMGYERFFQGTNSQVMNATSELCCVSSGRTAMSTLSTSLKPELQRQAGRNELPLNTLNQTIHKGVHRKVRKQFEAQTWCKRRWTSEL